MKDYRGVVSRCVNQLHSHDRYRAGLAKLDEPSWFESTISNWPVYASDNLVTLPAMSRYRPRVELYFHPYYLSSDCVLEVRREIFFHELSHAISRHFMNGRGHNEVWQSVFAGFGYQKRSKFWGQFWERRFVRKQNKWYEGEMVSTFKQFI